MSETYNQMLPSYTVGVDAYNHIPEICRECGTKIVVVGGHRAMAAAKPYLEKALKGSEMEILGYVWYGGEASMENSEMINADPTVQKADMIFACGGGKATDANKYACNQSGKALFNLPTIASTCAPCSTEAIMYYPNHVHRDTVQMKRPARHIFINTQVIAEAPAVYLWAGIGDTIAKHFETSFASRGKDLDHGDSFAVTVGYQCYEPLVKFSVQAMEDCKNNKVSRALEQIVLCNIVTTGMVSNFIIYYYNCSVAHALTYGFTVLPQIEEKHLHGEVVSYGVLVLLTIDKQIETRNKLIALYKQIALPTKLADLEVTADELDAVIEKSLTVEDITWVCYPVTGEMLRNGIAEVEAYTKNL